MQNPQEKHLCQSIFFNKVAGLRSATLLKKKLWHRCFPVNFAKFLRTPLVQNTSTSGRLSYKERRCQTKFLEGCCWGAGFYWRRFMIFFTFTFAKEAKEVAINRCSSKYFNFRGLLSQGQRSYRIANAVIASLFLDYFEYIFR